MVLSLDRALSLESDKNLLEFLNCNCPRVPLYLRYVLLSLHISPAFIATFLLKMKKRQISILVVKLISRTILENFVNCYYWKKTKEKAEKISSL
jgi:hypothetical protein